MNRKEKKEKEKQDKTSKERAHLLQNKGRAHLLQDKYKPVISVGIVISTGISGGIVVSTGETHSILQTAPELCFLLSERKETFRVFPVVVTSGPFFLQ